MNKTYLYFFLLLVLMSMKTKAQKQGMLDVIVPEISENPLYTESHALIIGISNYENGWPSLAGVKKDVAAVKEALIKRKFNVIVKEDLNKEELDKAFIRFISKYGQGKEARLLFYFAGHGHTLNNYGEVIGYIVPSNSPNPFTDEGGFIESAIPLSRIEEYAKQIKSKHALFLFDACFSGSLFSATRAIPEIISYKTAKPVRQFITSGSEDETVPDKSIFRQQFVEAMTTKVADANEDGYLTGTELGKFLQDNVINYSKNTQHPQYGKIKNQYLDKGDFVFILDEENRKVKRKPSSTKVKANTEVKRELSGKLIDNRDGKGYNTAKIGKDIWMTENLAFKPERGRFWQHPESEDITTDGYFYDWATAQTVCPDGWHLPTKQEFSDLYEQAGNNEHACYKQLTRWNNGGFDAQMKGYRYPNGSFGAYNEYVYFWAQDYKVDKEKAFYLGFNNLTKKAAIHYISVDFGFMVRCVRDKHVKTKRN